MQVRLGVLLPGQADGDKAVMIEQALDAPTRRFLMEIAEVMRVELSAVWLAAGPEHQYEFVAMPAGTDPLPVLEQLAETSARSWIDQLIPTPCLLGQGLHAMARFPLPCFIEECGFGAWLNGKKPAKYAGLFTRVEDAARLNFDHDVVNDDLCSIVVPDRLTDSVAQYLSALAASRSSSDGGR